MSGLLDWIKEEPETPRPSRKPDVYLLVRVRNELGLKVVREALHDLGADDIPLRLDGHNWPYITGNKSKAKDFYASVDDMFTSVMNYAKGFGTRQRDFVRAGAR